MINTIIKKFYHFLDDPAKKFLKKLGLVHLVKKIFSFMHYGLKNEISLKNLYDIKMSFKYDHTYEFRANYLPNILDNTFEPQTIKLLKNVIKKNDTIIDCGSNFGLFSLLACYLSGSDGKVYAFDASKETCDSLNENKRLNRFSNLNVNHYALSDKSMQEVEFYGGSGGGTIIKDNPLYNTQNFSQKVNTISLDDFFADKKIQNLKLIKIDVEGSEYFVLKGMKELIKRNPNTIITFELTKKSMEPAGYNIHDIVRELKELRMDYMYDITNLYLIKKINFDELIPLFENNEIGSFTKDNGLLVELLVMTNTSRRIHKFS